MSVKFKNYFDRVGSIFYYLSKIVGLKPYYYDVKKGIFKPSIFGLIISTFLALLYIISMPFVLISVQTGMKETIRSDVGMTVSIIRIIMQWMSVIVTLISNIFYNKVSVQYFNMRKDYEKFLSTFIPTAYRTKYFFVLSLTMICLFIVRIVAFYSIMASIRSINNIKGHSFPYFAMAGAFFPVAITTLSGFNFYMEMLHFRFYAIQINHRLFELLVQSQTFPKYNTNAQKMIMSCEISDRIDELIILYAKLEETLLILNNAENSVLGFYFLNKLFELIIHGFLEFLTATGYSSISITSDVFTQNILNNILGVLEIVLMVLNCENFMEEVLLIHFLTICICPFLNFFKQII